MSKTALRLRVHMAAIFNKALADGDRPLAMGNPADARLLSAMRPGKIAPNDEHYARINLTDAPLAIAALREARRCASDTLLAAAIDAWVCMASCALRPSEALKMQWSEVDLEKRLVTIAAPRMKGRKGKTKPHAVPLSPLALEVLERRRALRIGDNPNVFCVDGPPPSHTFFALAPLKAQIKPLLADKPKSPIGTPHSSEVFHRLGEGHRQVPAAPRRGRPGAQAPQGASRVSTRRRNCRRHCRRHGSSRADDGGLRPLANQRRGQRRRIQARLTTSWIFCTAA